MTMYTDIPRVRRRGARRTEDAEDAEDAAAGHEGTSSVREPSGGIGSSASADLPIGFDTVPALHEANTQASASAGTSPEPARRPDRLSAS
ncbi:hypothetical protein AB8O38_20620 [Saccharomonospora xinjiangensis]|uniref:hypothetical protein n=1 Tax=Saccharomonospora xinjiangensis TaxID=75294 RepID=UPI00350FCB2C